MQWFDYLLIGVVIILAGLAIFSLAKRRKQGGCHGCSSCPYTDKCAKLDKKKDKM